MADEKEKNKKGPDQKELTVSKDASIDFPVKVRAKEADPYHETGAIFEAGEKKAKELVKRGWVELVMISLLTLASFTCYEVNAQTSVLDNMYNTGTTHFVSDLATVTATRDTVTDTGVAALYSKRIAGPGRVTITVVQTKVSGTVAGTLVLSGSLNGTSYSALNTEETQTALATKTLTDATGTTTYHWRLKDSPFLYYRISASGGTTCVYYLDAQIMKHGQ